MQTFFQTLFFILIFGAIVFMAYVATKILGKAAGKTLKGKHVNIIETVSMGFDKHVVLVKVGEKYILLSSCGKSLGFLTEVSGIDDSKIIEQDISIDVPGFKSIIEKYIGRQSKKADNVMGTQSNFKSSAERIRNSRNLFTTNDEDEAKDEKKY